MSIAALLDGAIDLQIYGLRSGGVAITRDYGGPLPNGFADPDQVQQIVVNLLVNAAQALETASGNREIRVSARAGPDRTLRVVVADSGPGVHKEIAARIFEPFFTTKPQGSGTGIGLSVSRGLAEAQGGRLTLQPSPLGGAAFELDSALRGRRRGAGERGHVRRRLGAGSSHAPAGAALRRAIIIDDEAEIAVLLSEALRKAGYACDVAASGREAQALIAAHAGAYDAVVCDLRMPDMDGQTLFRWIEAHHPALCERTLFVTGDALGTTAGVSSPSAADRSSRSRSTRRRSRASWRALRRCEKRVEFQRDPIFLTETTETRAKHERFSKRNTPATFAIHSRSRAQTYLCVDRGTDDLPPFFTDCEGNSSMTIQSYTSSHARAVKAASLATILAATAALALAGSANPRRCSAPSPAPRAWRRSRADRR